MRTVSGSAVAPLQARWRAVFPFNASHALIFGFAPWISNLLIIDGLPSKYKLW